MNEKIFLKQRVQISIKLGLMLSKREKGRVMVRFDENLNDIFFNLNYECWTNKALMLLYIWVIWHDLDTGN